MTTTHKNLKIELILALLLSLSSVPTQANTETVQSSNATPYLEGQVLIKFKSSTVGAFYSAECPLLQLETEHGLRISKHLSTNPSIKTMSPLKLWEHKTLTTQEIIKRLKDHPAIEYIEPNYIGSYRSDPNDAHFEQQWGLKNTGQLIDGFYQGTAGSDTDFIPAQKFLRPSDTEIVIAIADSGVKIDHPDLINQIWRNPNEIPGNGLDDDGNGYVDDVNGYAFGKDSPAMGDDNGHGTHVAGIIVAEANNDIGIAGAFPQAKLLPLGLDNAQGSFDDATVITALNYATAMKNSGVNIVVLNFSLGTGDSQAVKDAITSLYQAGIVFCAATSNRGRDVDHDFFRSYPDSFEVPNIIAIAASKNDHTLWGSSSYGLTRVDLAAPGLAVYSTSIQDPGYQFMDGTSQATPHVTAAVAFSAQNFPNDTVEQRIRRILDNVEKLDAFSDKVASGGVLNFLNLADTDKDNLADWWEMEHFTNLDSDGSGDSDQDGYTDLEEFLLGTGPNSANSNRKFETIELGSGNDMKISFPTLSNRTYQIQYNEGLEPANWKNLGNAIIGDGTEKTYQESLNITTNPNRFYRIRISWR